MEKANSDKKRNGRNFGKGNLDDKNIEITHITYDTHLELLVFREKEKISTGIKLYPRKKPVQHWAKWRAKWKVGSVGPLFRGANRTVRRCKEVEETSKKRNLMTLIQKSHRHTRKC
ncbi:hypothetical protein TNCV_2804631 [Trichonephila clavipes]|nr:hypothetical protein TNCV_2804631 [Trichonephila clavipes]